MKQLYYLICVISLPFCCCACSLPGLSGLSTQQSGSTISNLPPIIEATFHDTGKIAVLAIIVVVVIVILYYVLKKAELAILRIRSFMDYNLKLKITPADAQKWVASESDFTLIKKDSTMIVSTPISFDGSLIDLTLVKEKEKENEVKQAVTRN